MVLMKKKERIKTKKNIVLSTTVRLWRDRRIKKFHRQSTIAGSN